MTGSIAKVNERGTKKARSLVRAFCARIIDVGYSAETQPGSEANFLMISAV